MTEFFKIALVFFTGSILGWISELIYRRIAHGKWINPGFLTGPYLPLYGLGLMILYVACSVDLKIADPVLSKTITILGLTLAMTALEYVTGLIFIKGLKVKLWDYSDRWGNIDGIICPLFTLFWGLICAAYCLFIHGAAVVYVNFMIARPALSFFLGAVFGIFVIDNVYSFHVVAKVRKWASDHELVVRYENLKLSIRNRAEELKEKVDYVFSMRSKIAIEDELENYSKNENHTPKWKFFKRINKKSADAEKD